jgi:septal ring factor EnvC (AmiA/AmiB activator)
MNLLPRFVVLLVLGAATSLAAGGQQTAEDIQASRVDARIQTLQREAAQLAASARTLAGDLRKLEIERDLRAAEAVRAEAAVAAARQALEETTARLRTLEQERTDRLPALRGQMVDLYKRGQIGYARLLFGAEDLRAFTRASRAVSAIVELNRRRIEAHRRTLAAVRRERELAEARTGLLVDEEAAAVAARAAAARSVAAYAARIAEIDSRRDLAAQYVGELQLARATLSERLAKRTESAAPAVVVPLVPFRGALEWPVDGTLTGRFGQSTNRLGGSAVRNGIEVAVPVGLAVRAVHGGTVVHSAPFTGLGNLVIIDHGSSHYSLYGYLSALAVTGGQTVRAGQELGQVGASPAGPPALYFELRIDGRAVDPVQWLEPR